MFTTFDCDPATRREVAFENFFDTLQDLKYILTSDYSSLQEVGLSDDQCRWIELFRYHVMKMIDVFQQHPLFHIVYEEDDYEQD